MMKILITISLLLIIENLSACEGQPSGRHVNPDGTLGGQVSLTAKVESSAFVDYEASVCDFAWVSGTAQIKNYSQIRGNAWIRDNVLISDNVLIEGQSIVRGNLNKPVFISGNVHIKGSANVLEGSVIADMTTIDGEVTVLTSTIKGMSKLCGDIYVVDKLLNHVDFCFQSDEYQEVDFGLVSHSEDEINQKKEYLKLRLETDLLSSSTENFYIEVNKDLYSGPELKISQNEVSLAAEILKDGYNYIRLYAENSHHQKIKSREFVLFVGTDQKTITLSESISGSKKCSVKFKHGNKELTTRCIVRNDKLLLTPFPSGSLFENVEIKFITERFYVNERYPSSILIPDQLSVYSLPSYNNDSLDFQSAGWKISHPERVSIETVGSKSRLIINSHPTEEITISKIVQLVQPGLSFDFNMSDEDEVGYVILSSVEKDGFEEIALRHSAKIVNNEMLSKASKTLLLFKFLPAGKKVFSPFELLGGSPRGNFLQFSPRNLMVYNNGDTFLTPTREAFCDDEYYNAPAVLQNAHLDPEGLKYFSLGNSPWMPQITDNRIFGILSSFTGDTKNKLEKIELILRQGSLEKTYPLAPCWANYFKKHKLSGYHVLNSQNLLWPFFWITFNRLLNDGFTSDNDYIGMRIKATFLVGEKEIKDEFETNESFLRILVPFEIFDVNERDHSYGVEEHWDIWNDNTYRVGGYKWIRKNYIPVLSSILIANTKWKINDLSKLNGGEPADHKTHNMGVDADISFYYPFNQQSAIYNFDKLKNDGEWNDVLNEIEEFLKGLKPFYKNIQDIYIENTDPNKEKKYIATRFEHRCLEGRYIDINAEGRVQSLLKHAEKHKNHLHLRFHQEDQIVEPRIPKPPLVENRPDDEEYRNEFNYSDVIWTRDNEGQFHVFPKLDFEEPNRFKDVGIYWRLQNKRGFDDPTMELEYGDFHTNKNLDARSSSRRMFRNKAKEKYLYLMFVNIKNGGCVVPTVADTEEDEDDLPDEFIKIDLSDLPTQGEAKFKLVKTSNVYKAKPL